MKLGESVLVLHGLWMNRVAMHPLVGALRRAGFDAVAGHYRSMRGTLEENVERVGRQVAELLADRPAARGGAHRVHIVGHSLGGILALALLRADPDRYGRVVLLGSPVGGCQAARQFAYYPGANWLLGETAALWNALSVAEIPARSPVPSGVAAGAASESSEQEGVEVGAIAGSEPFGLAHFFVGLQGAHDGVVRVEETRVPGLADHLVMPVSHTGMLLSDAVAAQCNAFLLNGRFSRR